jgi:hypothetical protein
MIPDRELIAANGGLVEPSIAETQWGMPVNQAHSSVSTFLSQAIFAN